MQRIGIKKGHACVRLGIVLCCILLVFGVLFFACEMPENSGDTEENGETENDIEIDVSGTWMKQFDENFEYEEGSYADALILELAGENYERIFYLQTEQVKGDRGTFEILEDTLVITITESSDGEAGPNWVESSATVTLTFTLDEVNELLTVIAPDDSELELAKTVFENPEELVEIWLDSGEEFNLQSIGDYTYSDEGGAAPYTESGTWDAAAGLLRSVTTLIDDGGDQGVQEVWIGYLAPYTLDPDGDAMKLTLTYYDDGSPILFEYWDQANW